MTFDGPGHTLIIHVSIMSTLKHIISYIYSPIIYFCHSFVPFSVSLSKARLELKEREV